VQIDLGSIDELGAVVDVAGDRDPTDLWLAMSLY